MNLKTKPSAIRENKVFTLDMREISIQSAKADDNGAYISKGSAKKFCAYMMNGRGQLIENGAWYVNMKSSKGYNKVYVPEHEIYEVTV